MRFTVDELTIEDAATVFDWVLRLLREVGEEAEDLGAMDAEGVLRAWRDAGDRFHAFAAKAADGRIVGLMTLMETFAIYANGRFGVIEEMYVSPDHRSAGVGANLIDVAKTFGRARGWSCIDGTAPESERHQRARCFYEKQGFVLAGPKLKFALGT